MLQYTSSIVLQDENNVYDMIMEVESSVHVCENKQRQETKLKNDIQQRTLCMLDSTV
jgi:hypothetical protein